jgi:outer membrane protein OmpA-like peptidoglycan-associated protein/uncharacterized surface protein with fasciclin (FAS1) repeats
MGARAHDRSPAYRRRIVAAGLVAGALLAAFGAPWYVHRVEDDLERRVRAATAAADLDVTVIVSGQDVRLECERALDEPQLAIDTAADVRGVRGIDLDRTCRVDDGDASTSTTEPAEVTAPPSITSSVASSVASSVPETSPATSVASAGPLGGGSDVNGFATVADLVEAAPQFSILAALVEDAGIADQLRVAGPITMLAPTDAAFDELPADALAAVRDDRQALAELLLHHVGGGAVGAGALTGAPFVALGAAAVIDPDLLAGNGVVHAIDTVLVPDGDAWSALRSPGLLAVLERGRIRLSGTVASAAQRDRLVAAATGRLDALNVDDSLVVDESAAVDDLAVQAYAALVGVMPTTLAEGTARSGVDGHVLVGTHLGADAVASLRATASVVDAVLDLSPRRIATVADASAMSADASAVLAATPITFEFGTAELTTPAAAVLDRLAGVVVALAGTRVTVVGHTDTTGSASLNLVLSQARAQTVVDELVARGVPAEQVVAVGAGEREPVVVAGVEDEAASRRVVIGVEVVDG